MGTESEHSRFNKLVEQYQQGNQEALKMLIKRFHPKMTRTIYYHTRYQAPVDDIAQDCWYIIINKLADLDIKISFEAWALSIARRKSIDWIRKQQRQVDKSRALKTEAKSNAESRDVSDRSEKLNKIQIGIQELPPTQRIVLELFYLENLSLRETSKVLDISEGTVKSRLFYAREKLKMIIS